MVDIFRYVDEIVDYYTENIDEYYRMAKELKAMVQDIIVKNSDITLNVSYRVKDIESLKEKLIRNSLYRINNAKEEVVANIQDVIGIRIECKFNADEQYVYEIMTKVLSNTQDGIYFYNAAYPKVRFKMSDRQPVKQRNGLDIYKVDARYEGTTTRVNFEVQIKSMINVFWGEVEHKIVYKNPSFFMVEQQVVDSMMSIKRSLNIVDNQLHELYKRYKREDVSKSNYRRENIENVLSKLIYDTISHKMKSDIGFTLQFKDTCDSLVEYIFIVNNAAQMEDYGRVMMDTFYITGNLNKEEINFRETIKVESSLETGDEFIDVLGKSMEKLMNTDFNCHVFFLILFKLERASYKDTFETFIRYYKGRINANSNIYKIDEYFDREQAKQIKTDLITEVAYIFKRQACTTLLHIEGMKILAEALGKTVDAIVREKPDWEKEKHRYFLDMNNKVNLEN